MGAGHDHGHGTWAPSLAQRRTLSIAIGLLGAFLVIEVIGGLISGSLALLSDAGHMLTDILGLSMSLAAIQAALSGTSNRQRTYGLYRLEILAALANAVLLAGVAVWVIAQAVGRLSSPVEIQSGLMLVVALAGLIVNLVVLRMLHHSSGDSLNMEAAQLEVLADTVGSVAALTAGLVIWFTGWVAIDPVLGIMLGLWVLPRTWSIGRKAIRVLVQSAPPHLDLDALTTDLAAIQGVVDVHDLHVWTLTSGMDVASVHLATTSTSDGHDVLDNAKHVLRDDHGIEHATVQIDPPEHETCDDCSALAF